MTQRPTSRSARRRSRRHPQKPLPPPRTSRIRLWLALAGGLVATAVVAFVVLGPTIAGTLTGPAGGVAGASSGDSASTRPAADGSPAPLDQWPADPPGLRQRLTSHGLAVLTAEGTVVHIHEHLDLYVNGSPVQIPADVGIDQASGILSPLHTHDSTGVIHVESPTVRDFTLGEFFDVWGVTFNSSCIGSFCSSGDKQLAVYVDGAKVQGDPRAVVFAPHQEIVVSYGTPSQLPSPIPSSYDFPGGL